MSFKNMSYPPMLTPHSTNNIFSPMEIEKILDTTLTKDNCRFYKVKWVKVSWEMESEMTYFTNVIREFWSQYTDEALLGEGSTYSEQQDVLTEANQRTDNEKLDLIAPSFSSAEVLSLCGFQHFQDTVSNGLNEQHDVTDCVTQKETNIKTREACFDSPTSDNLIATEAVEFAKNSGRDDDTSLVVSEFTVNMEKDIATRFPCDKCERIFTSQKNYEIHYRSHKLKICCICSKEFTRLAHLKAHQEIHSNKRLFVCTECKKGFNDKTTLRKHKLTHSERTFACTQCSKLFQRREHLKRHIQAIHKNIRNHMCHVCGKKFHEKSSLVCHLNIHTGLKKHVCDDCGKAFTERSTLLNHKACHKNEKPFKCATCEKRFTRMATLKMHEKKHVSDPPSSINHA